MPARFAIGVDLGGTKLLAGAVAPDLGVHHRALRPARGLDQAALVDACVEAIDEARDAVGGDVDAVGVGIPCLIDQRTGVAVMAVNLPLEDVAFGALLSERLGIPVTVDNDANCAVLAETRAGAARGAREVAMLTLGTGIGGGLVLGGELYRGSIGAGAELGHVVVDLDGPRCQGFCPNRGCLEAVASGTALERDAARSAAKRPHSALGRAARAGRPLTGALVTELAHDGDETARAVITRIGRNLGVGLASLVNIFNPEVIVVGGGVIGAGEMLLGPAREELRARALSPSKEHVRVRAAGFGAESGMIGAALLARAAARP